MKKIVIISTGIAGLIGTWFYHRDKKYPLTKGYYLMNKFSVPDKVLTLSNVKLANRLLSKGGLPKTPDGIIREMQYVKTENEEKIPLSIYKPKDMNYNIPCLIYFHGGGFFLKDEAYMHKLVCEYVKKAKCMVVFVHYRTADEYPFPTPFKDCCNAIQYVWENTEQLNVNKNKIALGGDSTGGALTGACTLWCRDETDIKLCFQMLIYPVIDSRMETETMKKYVDCPLWNSSLIKKMWKFYLRNGINGKKEYTSPILAEDFSELPPSYIETAEYDCAHDEGIDYAKSLISAGAKVHLEDVKSVFHGYDVFFNTEITKRMIEKRAQALHSAFHDEYGI
ncbi:alpha/beta hydrolase [Terrisporobacter petrolearius]|uniref:alpha/beta hydrolase n=1 Tax=Terrisporobacter petrolearius TaxID=1460447 RepID=UPI001D168CEF|nr:alpha/beta hydrolase [Terrisporobacter petrolearius]MCC3865692.1 alpha/beta hydrolase [Terrisporobacter petrolearius]